jgi:hypothetical protein
MAKLKGIQGGKGPKIEARTESDWDVVIDYEFCGKVEREEFMCEAAQMNPPGFFMFVMENGNVMRRYALPAIIRLDMKKRMVSRVSSVIS